MKKTAFSVGGHLVALLITLTALAGCGQKGPLALPAQSAAAASAPASAAIVAPKP